MAELRTVRGTRDFLPGDSRSLRLVEDAAWQTAPPLRLRRGGDADLRVHRGLRPHPGRHLRRRHQGDVHLRRSRRRQPHPAPGEHRRHRPRLHHQQSRGAACRCGSSIAARCSATSGRRRAGCASSIRWAWSCSGVADPLADVEVIGLAHDVADRPRPRRARSRSSSTPWATPRAAPPTAAVWSTTCEQHRDRLSADSIAPPGAQPAAHPRFQGRGRSRGDRRCAGPGRCRWTKLAAFFARGPRRPRRPRHPLPAQPAAGARARLLLPHHLRVHHRRAGRAGHRAGRRPLRRAGRADGRPAHPRHRLGGGRRAADDADATSEATRPAADRDDRARRRAERARRCGWRGGCAPPATPSPFAFGTSLGKQLKWANKIDARLAVIVGADEVARAGRDGPRHGCGRAGGGVVDASRGTPRPYRLSAAMGEATVRPVALVVGANQRSSSLFVRDRLYVARRRAAAFLDALQGGGHRAGAPGLDLRPDRGARGARRSGRGGRGGSQALLARHGGFAARGDRRRSSTC